MQPTRAKPCNGYFSDMKIHIASLTVYVLMALVVLPAGQQTAIAQVAKDALWRSAVKTDLAVDFGDTGFHGRWQYQRCKCGDLLVKVEQVAPDGILSGELLTVNGKVLLSRGFAQQGMDTAALMQAPSLMLQLAYELLNRSQPKGPWAVTSKQKWRVKEARTNFNLDTGLTTGIFAAPWRIKGTGWKTDTGHRRFELSFRFSNPAPGHPDATDSITFSGDLDFEKEEFPYQDEMPLTGWHMQRLSGKAQKSEPVPEGMTLKELRQPEPPGT